jgi:hypothetical protein
MAFRATPSAPPLLGGGTGAGVVEQQTQKPCNVSRFFAYRLQAENTLATWLRNAMLTTRVALAVHVHGKLEHTKTILFFLCLGAVLAAGWGVWRYYENSCLFAQLQAVSLRGRHLRDELGFTPYDTVWVVAGAALSAGVGVMAWEMVL